MPRRHLLVLALALTLTITACEETTGNARPGRSGSTNDRAPSSMAALGDSLTSAFGSCLIFAACTRNSWSTGSSSAVDSHYRRILKSNPSIRGHAHNYAEPGARAADLTKQAQRATDAKVAYVTLQIGPNDACHSSVGNMTPVAKFRSELDRALAVLHRDLPRARILVVSIPDLYRVWELGHTHKAAVKAWSVFGICPALLADATSTDSADDQRRRAVRDRIDDYDHELSDACHDYGRNCRWDGGAVHRTRFTIDEINHVDWFHPDASGQDRLAEVTWRRAGLR